ncbi:ribosomal protein L2 [Bradyrhizobium japonicum USDA 38]|nr:ribosomal protein L2 [Bradyrhizobium japonicum USDA 38]MCS3947119.1 ribosomal protein L2 [Bradyrhizobium japonicum]MCW2220050.1 ribosomal protein L2 [Bradyrhizobium japonicum]MCW2344664.1 ribosomal protein L2 [Bradyrhizobium japonicum]
MLLLDVRLFHHAFVKAGKWFHPGGFCFVTPRTLLGNSWTRPHGGGYPRGSGDRWPRSATGRKQSIPTEQGNFRLSLGTDIYEYAR